MMDMPMSMMADGDDMKADAHQDPQRNDPTMMRSTTTTPCRRR